MHLINVLFFISRRRRRRGFKAAWPACLDTDDSDDTPSISVGGRIFLSKPQKNCKHVFFTFQRAAILKVLNNYSLSICVRLNEDHKKLVLVQMFSFLSVLLLSAVAVVVAAAAAGAAAAVDKQSVRALRLTTSKASRSYQQLSHRVSSICLVWSDYLICMGCFGFYLMGNHTHTHTHTRTELKY